jgi:outer membrane protein assembly factor BamB
MKSVLCQVAVITIVYCASASAAETSKIPDPNLDWPCFRGLDGCNRSRQTGIRKDWGKGLTKIWEFEVCTGLGGRGFSEPVVSRGRLVVMGFEGKQPKTAEGAEAPAFTPQDIVYCLDATTDKPTVLWKTKMEAPSVGMEYGDCAYATPYIDGDTVYTFTTKGSLSALSMKDGKILWSRDLVKEENARRPAHGFACSPLIVGNLLVLDANYGATAIAFDKASGKTVWKNNFGTAQDYGTPVLCKLQGKDELVFFNSLYLPGKVIAQVSGIDPQTGKILWAVPCGECGMGPGTSPLVVDDTIFVTSAFGCKRLQIGMDGPKELWDSDAVKSLYNDGVLVDGYLYTTSGGVKVVGGTPFKCIDFKTGKECWSKVWDDLYLPGFGNTLTLTYVDGCLLAFSSRGELMLIKPDPKAYTLLGSFVAVNERPEMTFLFTQPVVAQGRVYLRGDQKVHCFDLMK